MNKYLSLITQLSLLLFTIGFISYFYVYKIPFIKDWEIHLLIYCVSCIGIVMFLYGLYLFYNVFLKKRIVLQVEHDYNDFFQQRAVMM